MHRCTFAFMLVAALLFTVPAQAQNFVESFESGLPVFNTGNPQGPPGVTLPLSTGNWFAINLSSPIGIAGVFAGDTTVFLPDPSGGASYAAMDYQAGSGLATIAVWLMSPTRTFNNGDTISFLTRTTTGTFPDRLNLRLSLNGASTDTNDFSTNLLTINPNLNGTDYPTTWTQFTVTLSGLSGPTSGRFAFDYDVPNGGPNGANSDYIGVDLATYVGASVPEPATWALLGAGVATGIGYLYRRRQLIAKGMESSIRLRRRR